jgi:hypothetical protein
MTDCTEHGGEAKWRRRAQGHEGMTKVGRS